MSYMMFLYHTILSKESNLLTQGARQRITHRNISVFRLDNAFKGIKSKSGNMGGNIRVECIQPENIQRDQFFSRDEQGI